MGRQEELQTVVATAMNKRAMDGKVCKEC